MDVPLRRQIRVDRMKAREAGSLTGNDDSMIVNIDTPSHTTIGVEDERSVRTSVSPLNYTADSSLQQAQPPANSNLQIAKAAPLGQIGYAIAASLSATITLFGNEQSPLDSTFAVVVIFLGGCTQLAAALSALVSNNGFAGAVFGVYGLHWVLQGIKLFIKSLQKISFEDKSGIAEEVYAASMFVISILFFIPTIRMNVILSLVIAFITLSFAFSFGAKYDFPLATTCSAVTGLCSAMLSMYLGTAGLINEALGRVILPIFPLDDHEKDYYNRDKYVPKRTYHKSSVSQVHM